MGRVIKAGATGATATAVSAEARAAAQQLLDAQAALNRFDELAKARVIDLALAMAERIVGEAVRVSPELLEEIYERAVERFPSRVDHGVLEVHPADRASCAVDELARGFGLEVREDDTVGRGGVRVCCGGAVVDASLEALLGRIHAVLHGAPVTEVS